MQDRCYMEKIIKQTDEFVNCFKEELIKLRMHDFTAKAQSSYLYYLKERLLDGEFICIVIFRKTIELFSKMKFKQHTGTHSKSPYFQL